MAITPRLASQLTATAACNPGAGAHINPPDDAQITPYEHRVRRVLACSPAAGDVYAFTVHSSPDGSGPYIAVHVSIAAQPDATATRQAIYADAFVLQRSIWQSDLRPAAVGIDFGDLANCQLLAHAAAHVDWPRETPAHAWSSVYQDHSPSGLLPSNS